MGYHSYLTEILTIYRKPGMGPWQMGSLTGAVASQRVTEALKGTLRMVGNHSSSVNADKSYPGDNRLISPKSSHRRRGLAPRCRLIASWRWIRFQGLGCPPIKAVRELGSERRETVRSLSVAGVGNLRGAVPSTRGPGWTLPRCTGCRASGTAGWPRADPISAEGI